MNRRRSIACLLALASASRPASAQQGPSWRISPEVTVIGADAGDPRFAMVEAAVAFWNERLEEAGTPFRLGPVRRFVQPVPEEALRELSAWVVDRPPRPAPVAEALKNLPGDLRVVLGDSDFVSFAMPLPGGHRRVVGIRALRGPLIAPNVGPNLIAHELGHAIGLVHNADDTALMCGRPSPCRPEIYANGPRGFFPLLDSDRQRLAQLYPPEWRASPR